MEHIGKHRRRQAPGVRIVARAVVAIDEIPSIGQRMDRTMRERVSRQPRTGSTKRRVMRNSAERDDDPQIWQSGELPFEEGAAVRDFGGRRLVLGRQAFDAVDDNRPLKAQPIVDARVVNALTQSELGKRREQQVASIVAGKWTPRPVRPMLSGREACEREPSIWIAKGVNRGVPPVGMIDPTLAPKRDKPRTAQAIAGRLGSRQGAYNLHAAAIGAPP